MSERGGAWHGRCGEAHQATRDAERDDPTDSSLRVNVPKFDCL